MDEFDLALDRLLTEAASASIGIIFTHFCYSYQVHRMDEVLEEIALEETSEEVQRSQNADVVWFEDEEDEDSLGDGSLEYWISRMDEVMSSV